MEKQTVRAYCVYDDGSQRFYRVTNKFTKHLFYGQVKDTVEELSLSRNRVKEKYRHTIPTDGYELICISDANTHIERLAFVAAVDEEIGYFRTDIQADGVHTMMIHGGDTRKVYNDLTYIRRLARINGYQLINEEVEANHG